MKKTVITRRTIIDASKQKVWETLADFGNVQNLSPNISKSYLTSYKQNGIGATRHCDFTTMGAQVDEKIIEWNEGVSLRIELFNPKNLPMMQEIQAYFEIKEQGNSTSLEGIFEYEMSNVVGDFLNSIKMRKMNIKSWEQFMAGIKHYVENDENVDQKTKLDLTVVKG
jgi:carbon monoxide dehydrogenase subunit G